MTLFNLGDFVSHSGFDLSWKIDCDALVDEDWAALALLISQSVPAFGPVEGVPEGGIKLAVALEPYRRHGPLLIVDDVLTTGQSMEEQRAEREARGVVVFSRGPSPEWVTPIFRITEPFR